GQTNLRSPQDVQVYAVNTNFTLRWNYTGNDTDVTFSAEYRFEDFKPSETEWKELPGCQNVTRTECDISSAITKYDDMHHLRVRVERREEVSPWSGIFEMIPYFIAQIGPPGIELQSTNGVIKIKVSSPEANQDQKIWINDLIFNYNLVIWENSSNPEFRSLRIVPTQIIDDLAPNTTYCLKVQAIIPPESEGLFSPIHCVKTTHKAVNDMPCATNLSIFALNMKFHLHWNNQHKQHVSYNVQYLFAYLKTLYDDYSVKWLNVPGCVNITETQCNFSSIITTFSGLYLRVQTMGEYNKSCVSKELKVNPLVTNEIGPPDIKLDMSDALLHIQISSPGGSQSEVMRKQYDLSYRVLYWQNSSNNEEEIQIKETKQTIGMVSNLAPSTLYCVKVQAISEAYNKSSGFSQVECIKTPGDKKLPLILLATFVTALVVVLLVAALIGFALYQAYNKITYVFFPSCQPPLNIEGFGEQPFISPYLSATEEQIENCFIIETNITEEVNQIDFKDYKHSKQSSRDSGTYSNDNNSGSKVSEEILEKEIL
ncbi:INAR1 protein, partial [Geococcyx californianus]|nr:INAR1 protein [Geococcyx californianus]